MEVELREEDHSDTVETTKSIASRADEPIAGPSRPSVYTSPRKMPIQSMIVPIASQEEYGDLLMGLNEDDMNDFDGLDDFGDHEGKQESQAWAVSGDTRQLAGHSADPFGAGSAIPLAGFTTGKGKPVAPPSNAALEKVRKMFQEVEQELDIAISDQVDSFDTPNKRCKIGHEQDHEEYDNDDNVPDIPAPDFVQSQSAGFLTGKGKAVPPPSRAAMEKALKIIAAVEEEKDETVRSGSTPQPVVSMSSFTTGNGNAVAGPSRAAAAAVKDLFSEDGESGSRPSPAEPEHLTFATPSKTYPASGFTTGSGAPAGGMNEEARRRAMAIFGEDTTSTPSRPTTSTSMLPPTSTTPFKPLISSTATPIRSASQILTLPATTESGSALRTPLRTTTNLGSQRHATNGDKPKMLTPIAIKTPAAHRRVGLGRSPASRGRVKNTFASPFKNPSQSNSPLITTATMRTSTMAPSALSRPAPAPVPTITRPVFDLTKPPDRKNMKDAYLHPQYTTIEELKEMGLPSEIWELNPTNALTYQFIAEDARPLNNIHALTVLHREGCESISQKWVDNHWVQVLWKLAGQVQAKPALFDVKWNWGEVIAQLKYRYEREHGNAQRPIIRRIQEHDSSPSLPMILCVAAVHLPEPSPPAEDGGPPPRPYLELTDGWYKVLTEVDDCLARAVTKGKIRVGRKLAVSGAKLDSGSEGADALEAFEKSRLIISGNSTSMARWHSKMGLQPQPFIAGLSSLSVDGGQIVLMDIIVEKLYPIAYVSSVKGAREGPWDEKEERVRADQWRDKYLAESTTLREKMRKQLESMEDLVETLCAAAQDVSEPVNSTPPETLDRDFDELVNASNATARIRSMSSSHIVHLATFARSRMQQEIGDGNAEVEAELQTACPAREIRDFRMARIVDAREGDRDATRVGMLNIWEAKSLGEGTLREGGRYLVSSLMPGRQGDWSLPTQGGEIKEIYLHTRRDTRWQEVGVAATDW